MAAIATLTFGTAFTAVAAGYSLAPAGPGMRAAPAAAIAADRIALRDDAIAATAVSYLDGVWTASTEGDAEAGTPVDTINATVPGDIISDLFAAGRVGNPLFENNFKDRLQSSLWTQDWTYSRVFSLQDEWATSIGSAAGGEVLLVFDSVKMGANVSLNGQYIGTLNDQFRRYIFPISAAGLKPGANTISVSFASSISCGGRWMACTGGWDWAPYSDTQQEGAATFSKGIVKSVYLARVEHVAVTHVVPHTFYLGDYPTQILEESTKGDFQVRVRVHLWAPTPTDAVLTVGGEWGASVTQRMQLPKGDSNTTVVLRAVSKDVLLWWPAGTGAQPLYGVNVTVAGGSENRRSLVTTTSRRIGFRQVALVTGNDTDPSFVQRAASEQGTELHGMMFRVNGAPLFARGANMIPQEELEGWYSAAAHAAVVQTAADSNLNMLRVW